jgi:hypothetical protein
MHIRSQQVTLNKWPDIKNVIRLYYFKNGHRSPYKKYYELHNMAPDCLVSLSGPVCLVRLFKKGFPPILRKTFWEKIKRKVAGFELLIWLRECISRMIRSRQQFEPYSSPDMYYRQARYSKYHISISLFYNSVRTSCEIERCHADRADPVTYFFRTVIKYWNTYRLYIRSVP